MEKTCKHCGKDYDSNNPDPCLNGHIPGVRYACCGHGDPEQSYIMFTNRAIVKGPVAYEFIIEYKKSLILEEAYKRVALKHVRDLRDRLYRPGESPSDMDLTGLYV